MMIKFGRRIIIGRILKKIVKFVIIAHRITNFIIFCGRPIDYKNNMFIKKNTAKNVYYILINQY